MDEEDGYSPSEFCHPELLEKSDLETDTDISESQEVIDDFINKQKSVNPNTNMATEMNTLLHYMEASGIESLPATELDHLLSKLFMNTRRKNEQEYEPAAISSFQRSIQQYLLYGLANDPRTANDPGPEMIPDKDRK